MSQVQALSKYYTQLDNVGKGLEQEAYKIIANVQYQIVKLNTDNLLKGLTPLGQKLKPSYSRERYKRAKNKLNPLPGIGTPDLKLTGDFHKSFYVVAKNEQFSLEASDDKTGLLSKKYGEKNIFGLTVEDNEIVNYELILPKLLEWVLSQLTV